MYNSDAVIGEIPTWSFSRLINYEKCPYIGYLQSVKKLKRKPQPDDSPLLRGSIAHDDAEKFVRGTGPITEVLKHYKADLKYLANRFPKGTLHLEEDWGFDINWNPCGYYDNNVWGRMKLDVADRIDPSTMKIIDYKSGKKFGNEVKHIQQGQSYVIGAFMKFPEVDLIEMEFLYFDHKATYLRKTYARNKLALYLKKFNDRVIRMTTATTFPAKPSAMNCKYCDYGKENGTDECQYCHYV